MKKNHMKKMAALLMVAVLGGTVQAFDFSTFPSPIEPGDFLLSAGGGIVPTLEVVFPGGDPSWEIPVLFGGFAKIDYALLIPFTVGVEGGFFAGKTFGRDPGTELALVPIMGRFTWHPNWGVGNLDTYIGVKAGYGMATLNGSGASETGGGFAVGSEFGIRYFFTPMIGISGGGDCNTVFATIRGDFVLIISPVFNIGITFKL